jgi:threonine dehydratase
MESPVTRPTGWGDPPAKPPTLDDIRRAAERIRGVAVRTPLVPLAGNDGIRLKPETLQPAGSFKLRGAWNWAAGRSPVERQRGFSTFSAGNTALALGWCARRFGVSCRSLLPDYAPDSKLAALRTAGVETVLIPFARMADWLFRAGWRDEPWTFLHPWTEPAMLAGHGTIGLEIAEDCQNVSNVFVPVGGGALLGGVAAALKALVPAVRVVAVQSEACPALAAARRAGRPVWIEPGPTLCDGTAVPFITDAMYPLLAALADDVVTVTEAEVGTAIRRLWSGNGIRAEGAGALALAAAIKSGPGRGPAVALVTGGSIDNSTFDKVLSAGPVAASGY